MRAGVVQRVCRTRRLCWGRFEWSRGAAETRRPVWGFFPRLRVSAVLSVLGTLLCAEFATAQTADPPINRLEAAFSAGWLGGAGLGGADANLRTRTGGEYLLFTTASRVAAVPAIEARASYSLTRRYALEARFGFSRPRLRTSVSGDIEGVPEIEVEERFDQYTFEGAIVVMLPGLRFASLVPFASAGGGYLRQLHEGLTLIEEGVLYHVGGGVKHALFARQQGFLKGAGVRGDVRLNILTGGIELEEKPRLHVAALGGVFVTF